MKKILLILACLLSMTAFAQTDNMNNTDAKGRKQGRWQKTEHGKIVYEGQFKDDVPYGEFTYYHEDGKLKSKTEFLEGVHKVKTTIFHENGHKASEGVFIDQQKDGVWNYYANNDHLIKVEQYAKGTRTGQWKVFSSETGVLLEEKNYVQGHLDGLHKTYYVDGAPSLEDHYVNGKLNGRSTSYFPGGKISSTGDYHNGLRIGPWDSYDTKGLIRSTMEYKDQRVLKTFVYLYQKGQGQKINQDMIAYFQKAGDKSVAILRNGNRIPVDESLDDIMIWADFTVFTRIAPSVIAATDAIVGYKEVEGDEDAIIVKLRPALDDEVYAEGNEAKMVKALFNTSKPTE